MPRLGQLNQSFYTSWGRQRADRRTPTSDPFASSWGGHGRPGQRYVPPKSPAAPKPPASSPGLQGPAGLPVDPTYDQQVGGYTRRRDDSLAATAQQQTGTLADYGYGATFDPAGNVTGLSFDPANPFSRAALLRRNYQQSKAGTQTSMGARGQLFSGAYGRAQEANTFGYLQGENALQKGATDALIGYAQRRRGAGTDYELGVGQAGAERVGRATAADTGEQALATPTPGPASTAGGSAVKRGPRGEPALTIRGKKYYRRAADNKLIPLP